MEVKLVVLNGKHKNREIPLPRTVFLIGRDADCHLRLHSLQVSRRHCAIACWAGKVSVRDLKSANGTFINNQRIVGEVKVSDGDRLQVGPLAFFFRIKHTPPEKSPEPITPGSLRWLLEHAREARPVDLGGSTEAELIVGLSDGGSEPADGANLTGATFSPGEFFFKSICNSAKAAGKPGALLRSVPLNRIPPAGGAETGK
jgi:pSer/pThr/pTyr-binding forkhead associated (FHA) protein